MIHSSFRSLLLTSLLTPLAVLLPGALIAGPSGGSVTAGDATIHSGTAVTTIEQLSSRAIINWDDFSIGAGHRVDFLHSGIDAATLNRVTGGSLSHIEGALSASGRVFILNPNGILFGAGARVDVGGLVATTLGIADDDFLSDRLDFHALEGAAPSFVENRGRIAVADDGFAYLVAPGVANSGLVVAQFGEVVLASGNRFTLDFTGNGLLTFDISGELLEAVTGVDGESLTAAVENSGHIHAHGGHVLLSGETARHVTARAVNNTGIVEATSIGSGTGSVQLHARSGGDVINTGIIDVSGSDASDGGSVAMLGGNVGNLGVVQADGGASGSGGAIALRADQTVVLGGGSLTSANAGVLGDGGEILVIGERAHVDGGATLQARGGADGGDGGFVETSGLAHFRIGTHPDVSAPAGAAGVWLIDPNDIDIVAGAGAVNVDAEDPFQSAGDGAELGVDLVTAALALGNVSIITTTEGANSEQGNIRLLAPLTYTDANASSLTLHAHNNILIDAAISSTAAALDVSLHADSAFGGGAASGVGSVSVAAPISTFGGSLTSSGVDFSNTSAISTAGGSVDLSAHRGLVQPGAGILTGGGDFVAGGSAFDSTSTTVNTSGGSIVISTVAGEDHEGDVSTGELLADTGSIAIAADGDLSLADDVSTTGAVELSANGAVTQTAGTHSVSAGSALVSAGSAIGSGATPLRTDVLNLTSEVSQAGGTTHLHNAGALQSLNVTTNAGAVGVVAADDELSFSAGVLDIALDDPLVAGTAFAFSNTGGAVQLGTAAASLNVGANELSVTAAAGITDGGHPVIASDLALIVTDEGASIGAEGAPLRLLVEQLDAQANFGHIVVRQQSGDLRLGRLDTGGDRGEDDVTRVIVQVPEGAITTAGSGVHLSAWAANLLSAGSQGTGMSPINTAVSVFNATTDNGGIHINDTEGQLLIGNVIARERVDFGGESVIITPFDSEGHVVLTTGGQVGTHNVSITAVDDVIVTGRVVAPNELAITSSAGSLYRAAAEGGPAFIARHLTLQAAGAVGQTANPFMTQTSWFNASAADGGVHASESHTLRIGSVSAAGDDADVRLVASIGDLRVGDVFADGHVYLESARGRIVRDGAGPDIAAASVELVGDLGVGTAAAPLRTAVDGIAAVGTSAGSGLFITNTGGVDWINARTANGTVDISFDAGAVQFAQGSSTLSVGAPDPLDLSFVNTAGNLAVGSIDLGSQSLQLEASGAIVQATGGLLRAGETTLISGGSLGSLAAPVALDVTALNATAGGGDIHAANQGALTLSASATGSVRVQTLTGDIAVEQVQAGNTVTLIAAGALLDAGDDPAVTANSAVLQATTGIGADGAMFRSALTGELSAASTTGGIYLLNTGALSRIDVLGSDIVDIQGSADLHLGEITGTAVTIAAAGHVRDAMGDELNIEAHSLQLRSRSVGQAANPVEFRVADLDVVTTNGGIYLARDGSGELAIVQLRAGGSGSNVVVTAADDIRLGVVEARGNAVTIETTNGWIEDGRLPGESAPNVRANSLSITATDGVGSQSALVFDVAYLSARGGAGAVSASNLSPVAITPESLENKGSGGVTISAADITILDNQGGTTIMDPGGSLTLIAEVGNIVFLNLDDTIETQGGNIRFEALGVGAYPGENGVIIAGNLTSNGGNIELLAEGNVTIGLLDAGFGQGDVVVSANNGIILDANGDADNIIGRHVTLVSRMPSLRDAELTETQAIARYEARQGEAAAKQTLTDTLEASGTVLAAGVAVAQSTYNQSAFILSAVQRDLNREQLRLDVLNVTRLVLISARQAAQIVRDIAAFVTGAAQAVPFSGDAGADAAFAAVDVAFSIADAALMAFDESFSAQASVVADLTYDLTEASSNSFSAANLLQSSINVLDANQTAFNIATTELIAARIARDASGMVRSQAITAVDQRNMVGSVGVPLGIQAERLDVQSFTDTNVYLRSDGDLGLGNVAAQSQIIVSDVAGSLTLLGILQAGDRVLLDIDGGILAEAGSLIIAEELVATAGTGIGIGAPLLTHVDRLAADGGAGGVWIDNSGGGDPLLVTTINGVSGVRGAGDIAIATDADLVLAQPIIDVTAAHTVFLDSAGSIIDANGPGMNVSAERLIASANGSIDLDTAVDRLSAESRSAGDISLRQARAVELTSVLAADGAVDVRAAGDINALEVLAATDASGNDIELTATGGGHVTAGSIVAGVDHGVVSVTADGRIDHDGDDATRIVASRLNLAAGQDIGGAGSFASRALRTTVSMLDARVTGTGEINVAELTDLDVLFATTSSGGITITSDTGSLHVGSIGTSVSDTVTLTATGAITDLNDDSTVNITAGDLAAVAGEGIGSANNPVETLISRLVAHGGTGGIHITDIDGGLIIGGVTPNLGLPALTGLQTDGGDVVITVHSPIVIDEEIFNQTGDIVLIAGESDLADNLIINADIVAAGTDVTIDLQAADSILQNANVSVMGDGLINYTASSGSLVLSAAVQSVVGQSGGIIANAGGDVILHDDVVIMLGHDGDIRLLAQGGVTLGTDTLLGVFNDGEVQLSAAQGGVNLAERAELAVDGDGSLLVEAGQAITLGADARLALGGNGWIEVDAGTAIAAGQGVDVAVLGNGGIDLHAGTDVTLADQVSLRVQGAGDIAVSLGGSLTMGPESIAQSADGDVRLHAGGDLTVQRVFAPLGLAQLRSLSGSIAVNPVTDYNVVAAALDAHAANGIGSTASPVLSQVGSITAVNTGTGSIHIDNADAVTLQQVIAHDGRIEVSAGGDIDAIEVVSAADAPGNDIVLTASDGGAIRVEQVSAGTSAGEVRLSADTAGGAVLTVNGGMITGNRVQIAAHGGIDVTTSADRGEFHVSGDGDLTVNETGSMVLEHAVAENGSILVVAGGSLSATDVRSMGAGPGSSIALDAGGQILVGHIAADALVSLSAADAIEMLGAVGQAAGIHVQRLVLLAGDGIGGGVGGPIVTSAAALQALATAGDIHITESGGVVLEDIRATTGDVVIVAETQQAGVVDARSVHAQSDVTVIAERDGGVVVGELSAGGEVNIVSIGGAIDSDNNLDTLISGDVLILTAAQGIGTSGPSATRSLTTHVNTLNATVTGSGAINIIERDGLYLPLVRTADGDITLQVLGGNVSLGLVETGGTVTLIATGGHIVASANAGALNIAGEQLSIAAASGIGLPSRSIGTAVDVLSAAGGTGGVYINNQNGAALLIDAVQPGLGLPAVSGVMASGDIDVSNSGPLVINEAIRSDAGGDVSLAAVGAGADITINAEVGTAGGNGSIDIAAGGSIAQNAGIHATGNGDVSVTAVGDVTMLPQVSTTSHSGNISVGAGGTLTVGHVGTASGLGGGMVELDAGHIVDGNPGSLSISGGIVHVRAANAGLALMDSLAGGLETARMQVNGRVIGGELAEDARFIESLMLFTRPGAGGGSDFLTLLLWQPQALLEPVALLDDDDEAVNSESSL